MDKEQQQNNLEKENQTNKADHKSTKEIEDNAEADANIEDKKKEITPEEKILTEASPLEEMSKSELEEYGRGLGVELDKRHSRKKLISEIKEVLDNS